ncbi:MAG: hypothetical protein Kow00121_66120 [Elainellaceae cyanobacterium]
MSEQNHTSKNQSEHFEGTTSGDPALSKEALDREMTRMEESKTSASQKEPKKQQKHD